MNLWFDLFAYCLTPFFPQWQAVYFWFTSGKANRKDKRTDRRRREGRRGATKTWGQKSCWGRINFWTTVKHLYFLMCITLEKCVMWKNWLHFWIGFYRCKVYIKKDSQFKDMGVGTLFLKPTPNEKIQLIVRAANSLGNILINTLLFSGMSIQRTKDHTLLVHCMPMPNSEMTSVLLRVKTKEDADILLENLEKHTKK